VIKWKLLGLVHCVAIVNQSINQSINTLLTCCSLTNGVMATQALPPAEARVIRTPAHTHETVNTKENGVLPSKSSPNQSQNSIKSPSMPSIPRYFSVCPYIGLPVPLHLHPCYPSLVSTSSCSVLNWWRSLSTRRVGCIRPRPLGKRVWRTPYLASSPLVQSPDYPGGSFSSPFGGSGSISTCRNCPSRPV
jgi:hypothetical protein